MSKTALICAALIAAPAAAAPVYSPVAVTFLHFAGDPEPMLRIDHAGGRVAFAREGEEPCYDGKYGKAVPCEDEAMPATLPPAAPVTGPRLAALTPPPEKTLPPWNPWPPILCCDHGHPPTVPPEPPAPVPLDGSVLFLLSALVAAGALKLWGRA